MDTDDFVVSAYNAIKDTPQFKRALQKKHVGGKRREYVQMCPQVGAMGGTIPEKWCKERTGCGNCRTESDKSYFIKMTPNQLGGAYRRVIAREFRKIYENAARIREIISKSPTQEIASTLTNELHIGAISITTPLDEYIELYKNAAHFERKAKATFKSQSDIIKDVLKIVRSA